MTELNHASYDDLAAQIMASQDGHPVETNLATSQRIIARVTDGIYREPWAAFRELIANAYDADASHVVVETGAPLFDQITVRDNGIGMSPKTLAYVIKSIGGSSKRTPSGYSFNTTAEDSPDQSPGGRPLIGKIGIGLFAVAQLTQHFQIVTKTPGSRSRLSATVRLRTHNDDKYAVEEQDYVAGRVTIQKHRVPKSDIESHGTVVVLYSLRPHVRRSLRSVRRWQDALSPSDTVPSQGGTPIYHIGYSPADDQMSGDAVPANLPWTAADAADKRFVRLFESARASSGRGARSADLEQFDEYLRLIWKLSLSLPLDYLDGHPFDLDAGSGLIFLSLPPAEKQAKPLTLDDGASVRHQLKLRSGSARNGATMAVTLDGIALRRPIELPRSVARRSRVGSPALLVAKQTNPFAGPDLIRAGGPLSFEAYLYWNSQILPKETAGVLIRVREASGTLFDPTFLNYRVSEQTRLRQITAEIFVHTGLDSAINIDRESFNYSHPHILYLQTWLHRALRLFINRLKGIAAADLKRETREEQERDKLDRFALAEAVWRKRYGEDADSPLLTWEPDVLPADIGGTELAWLTSDNGHPKDKQTALAVVLEAYGALGNLPRSDRADLIQDVLDVLESKK